MKRRLFKLVVFLLLGAVVNVTVAWGCVLSFPVVNQPGVFLQEDFSPELGQNRSVQRTIGRTRINWLGYDMRPYRPSTTRTYWPSGARATALGPSATVIPDRSGSRELAGWPLRALTCTNPTQSFLYTGDPSGYAYRSFGSTPLSDVVNGIPVGHESVKLLPRIPLIWRALPYQPIWSGFALNTLFFAAILGIPLAPLAARRVIRRKRGQCIKCGYDLRGIFSAGCPECGWRRDDARER